MLRAKRGPSAFSSPLLSLVDHLIFALKAKLGKSFTARTIKTAARLQTHPSSDTPPSCGRIIAQTDVRENQSGHWACNQSSMPAAVPLVSMLERGRGGGGSLPPPQSLLRATPGRPWPSLQEREWQLCHKGSSVPPSNKGCSVWGAATGCCQASSFSPEDNCCAAGSTNHKPAL